MGFHSVHLMTPHNYLATLHGGPTPQVWMTPVNFPPRICPSSNELFISFDATAKKEITYLYC